MTDILLYFLIGELALLILWGLWRPSRVYQFPFLAGCVFALWAWPQFYRLHASGAVPDNMLNKALVMSILCGGMCYVGYQRGKRPIQKLNWTFNRNRLSLAALVMTVIGLVFQYKLSQIPDEVRGTQMSGLPVIYLFFAEFLVFGFALAVFLVYRRFSLWTLAIAGLGALSYIHTIVFAGRREGAIQFVLIIGTLAWFVRKKLPPRPVIVCGILAGSFICYNISVYRSAMKHGSVFGSGANVSQLKQMNAVTEEGTEMQNAVYYIAATETLGAYDFGLFHWNVLVFRYFPAQIFGASAKQNLMSLGGRLEIGMNAEHAYGYENSVGSTVGGITDAFASFWYFGCLEFFAIGYFMRRLYESALRGSPVWQIACALMTVYSLLAITHSTDHAVAPWVQAALFLGPALIYARTRPGEGNREIISAMQNARATGSHVVAKSPAWHGSQTNPLGRQILANLQKSKTGRGWFASRLPQRRLDRLSRFGRLRSTSQPKTRRPFS
jgi:hypothetical protein